MTPTTIDATPDQGRSDGPSRAVMLYGTEEVEPPVRLLRAGPVTATLDQGALRYLSVDGEEAVRAIACVVRDGEWGTYTPEIAELRVDQRDTGFVVTYTASCHDARQGLRFAATIRGDHEGTVQFDAVIEPRTDFDTARTGFVVLHPGLGVAGRPLRVTRSDGRQDMTVFPDLISPSQPVFDIRALSHQIDDGRWVSVRMDGDVFEMEDQRNWGDSSFKTYVRPLWKPRRYVLERDSRHAQSVVFSLEGRAAARPVRQAGKDGDAVRLTIGDAGSLRMPALGLGVAVEDIAPALARIHDLRRISPAFLLHQMIMPQHHGAAELAAHRRLSEAAGAEPHLEVVIAGTRDPELEVAEVAAAAQAVGFEPRAVTIFPASDLLSHQPGEEDPSVPRAERIIAAARRAFPEARIGGGMFTNFTELNRKRPPASLLDYVTHATCSVVHAADDRSVMETLETLPAIVASTRAFAGGLPYRIGPSGIAARSNPYGRSIVANPDHRRLCLTAQDPRQRGLFGAAWLVGHVAALARGAVEAVTLSAVTGPLGVIHRASDGGTAFFGHADGARLYPAFHPLADLAHASGSDLLDLTPSRPDRLAAIGWAISQGSVIWVANLTKDPVTLSLEAGPGRLPSHVAVLDTESWEAAAHDPEIIRRRAMRLEGGPLLLDAYAVARLSGTPECSLDVNL